MSAPTEHPDDPNSAGFYAPKGLRAVRLGEVSQAAAALIPEGIRDGDNRGSLTGAGGTFEGDAAIQRLRARRSLDPDVPPAPPLVARGGSWPVAIGRLAAVIIAAAVIAFFAVGQFPLPDTSRQQASTGKMELASTSTRPPAAVSSKRAEPVVPQLVAQNLRGNQGEPAPLGVRLHGQADGAIVMIIGLVPGMTLSTGGAVGANAWQIPVSDIGNAWIIPAKDFVGTADLVAELRLADNTIAHRRALHLEWVAAKPAQPAIAAAPAATPAPVATAPPAAPPARQLSRDDIAVLLKRSNDFMAVGDVAAARVLLQRAAEADDAQGALALAATYDPVVLRELKVLGVAPDIKAARAWYERAKELGSPEAPRRLEILASATR